MQVVEIGKTEEGQPHLAAIITAPENFAKLDRYKQISQQLHRATRLERQSGLWLQPLRRPAAERWHHHHAALLRSARVRE